MGGYRVGKWISEGAEEIPQRVLTLQSKGVTAPTERAFFANQGGTAEISVLGLLR